MYQDNKPKYTKQLFVCENMRDPKNDILGCCGLKHGAEIARRLKQMTSDAGLKSTVRVNRSACLGECADGVIISIQPQNICLKKVSLEDVDEIFQKYILAEKSNTI